MKRTESLQTHLQFKKTFRTLIVGCFAVFAISGCSADKNSFNANDLPNSHGISGPETDKLGSPNWSFKLSSYNVYGLKLISPLKTERMPAIGRALNKRNLDAALLQEAWTWKGRRDIEDFAGFDIWTYFDHPNSFGSGLFTMTNLPINSSAFRPFTMDGRLLRLWEGDRLTAKGISVVHTRKDGIDVDLFDMHTLARYGSTEKNYNDSYTPERLAQLFEAFDFIINKRQSPVFILGADMNSDISTEEFQFWLKLTGLESSDLSSDPNGCTYCEPNTFVSGQGTFGQIDHIVLSPYLEFKDIHRDYEETVPLDDGKVTSMSDHFGLTAEVRGRRTQRHYDVNQTLEALSYLRWRLEDYKNWYSPLDFNDQDPQPASTDIKGQIEAMLLRVNFFMQTLTTTADYSSPDTSLNDEAGRLRENFKNYEQMF